MSGVPQWMIDDFRRELDPGYKPGDAWGAEEEKRPRHIEPKRGAEIFAGTDYPTTWAGFVGQDEAKEQLMVQVASARARNARLEHTLLASGIHGVGKSTLATLLAAKANAGLLQVSGVLEVDRARALFKAMSDHDVLFWDEFHLAVSAGKSKAEWLLPFMTEGRLYTDEGAVECPDVTIVAATTDAGRLPETIISRFMVKPKLVPYTPAQATEIARSLSGRMGIAIEEDMLSPIARAANANPRDMRSILTAARDLQLAFPGERLDLAKAIRWAGFSEDGLTQTSRDILLILRMQKNYTCSVETLQGMLSEPGPLRHHEKDLLSRGLITITGRGRQLTDAGVARAERLKEEL